MTIAVSGVATWTTVADPDGFDAGAQRTRKTLDASGIVRIHRCLDPGPAFVILGIRHRVLGIDRHAVGADETVQCGTRLRADRAGSGKHAGGQPHTEALFIHERGPRLLVFFVVR